MEYEKYLSQLHKTIRRLENEHQQGINRLFNHYFHRLNQGEKLTTFVPYAQNEQADFILLALSAMYYSITQLAHTTLELGTTIHEVFELETTDLYQAF
jgi:flagellar biosynthesis chaperone FliJ